MENEPILRIGVVVPILLEVPRELFDSVLAHTRHDVRWYLYCHSQEADLESELVGAASRVQSKLTLHRWNRGIARSWNDGIIESYLDGSDLTLVVNDDVTFHAGAFDQFIEFLRLTPDFGLGFLHGFEAEGSPHSGETRSQDFACFGFGLAAFTRLGAFDENFFPAYSEDMDYFHRARRADVPIVRDGRALVDHARNKSARCVPGLSEQIDKIKAANSAYFRRKWGGDPGSTAYQYPFNESGLGMEIPWARRRHPYGAQDRPELAQPEPPCLKLTSGVLHAPNDLLDAEKTAADTARMSDGLQSAIRVAYLANLGRAATRTDIAHYTRLLRSGRQSLSDMCNDMRSSAEYRQRNDQRAPNTRQDSTRPERSIK